MAAIVAIGIAATTGGVYRKPFAVVQSRYEETYGQFSPDGRWITYQSNETGRNEVYVRPFPGPGPSTQVSTNGGSVPQWRGDHREIFYLAPDGRLMAVPIALSTNGLDVEAGAPVALFTIQPNAAYEASPDGQRFLVNTPLGDDATPPITILLNWAGARR